MSNDLGQVIGPAVGAAGGVAGSLAIGMATYLVARRQTSGRVETTDAVALWKSAEEIRGELRDDVVHLREDVHRLRGEAIILRSENQRLAFQVRELEEELVRLRGRVHGDDRREA